MLRHRPAVTLLAVTVFALSISSTVRGVDWTAYEPPPEGKVRIVRDTYGVPHIIAARTQDVYYGAGYCQAEDQIENVGQKLPPRRRVASLKSRASPLWAWTIWCGRSVCPHAATHCTSSSRSNISSNLRASPRA